MPTAAAHNAFQDAHHFVISGGTFVQIAGDVHLSPEELELKRKRELELKRKRELELKRKIVDWLNAPDPSKNYNTAREAHCEGTGTWFMNGKEFDMWKREGGNTLFIYGLPGSGKTILCSTIIENIIEHCKNTPASACAYFFFDGRNSQNAFQLHRSIICALIKQLSTYDPSIPAPLKELYGKGDQQPSLPQLEKALEQIIDMLEQPFIIIDSLDECREWMALFRWIRKTTQRGTQKLHFLATSRPEHDIIEDLNIFGYGRVHMENELVSSDIEKYIEDKINTSRKFKLLRFSNIKNAVLENADGMFRLVAFRLDELQHCLTPQDLQQHMKDLPPNLDAMYSQMLSKISSLDRPRALVILQWLAFAARALSLEEVAEVVTVDFEKKGSPWFNANCRFYDPQDVVGVCGGLIINSQGEIKLSHLSVKEYLISTRRQQESSTFHFNASLAHSIITKTCLAYLLQFTEANPVNEDTRHAFPLAEYAAKYWIWHFKSTDDPANTKAVEYELSMNLLQSGNDGFLAWISIYNPDSPVYFNYSQTLKSIPLPLYYTALMGLEKQIEDLIEKGADVNVQGGQYGYALQAASNQGHLQIVQLLLEKGADVNTQGGQYGHPLQAASTQGHLQIVQLLLEKGADANAHGGQYEHALQAATYEGHLQIVQLLLEKGADMNVHERGYGSALKAASTQGHLKIVQVLLEKGANVNAQLRGHGNALQGASSHGYLQIVQLLLDKGADVNVQGGQYGYALQAASYQGHLQIVKLLLEKGADVNAQGGRYGHALQAASTQGHLQIVQLLLEKGADVNVQGETYGNALQAASSWGHLQVVQLLLENGAY